MNGGCRNAPGEQAPEIPPASTFVMDFADFEQEGGKRVDFDPTAAQLGFENWGYAALNVGVWSVIITVGLAVPVAAFYESFNHEPELLDDGTFVWSYNFQVANIQHTAELHGVIMGNDVRWDMFISREGDYDDFNWYSGISTLTRTEGTWTLNKNPEEPAPFIDIEWNREPETELGDIRYTNVEPDVPQNGGYIAYAISDDEPYDASYAIYGAEDDNLIEIEWNGTTRAGRVRAPAHFGDSEWHCWDEDRQNADCPAEQ
jgi:hypothetical protein